MNDTQRLRLENAINEYARAKVQAFQMQSDPPSVRSLEMAEDALHRELDSLQVATFRSTSWERSR